MDYVILYSFSVLISWIYADLQPMNSSYKVLKTLTTSITLSLQDFGEERGDGGVWEEREEGEAWQVWEVE